jgi:hypothetical protein
MPRSPRRATTGPRRRRAGLRLKRLRPGSGTSGSSTVARCRTTGTGGAGRGRRRSRSSSPSRCLRRPSWPSSVADRSTKTERTGSPRDSACAPRWHAPCRRTTCTPQRTGFMGSVSCCHRTAPTTCSLTNPTSWLRPASTAGPTAQATGLRIGSGSTSRTIGSWPTTYRSCGGARDTSRSPSILQAASPHFATPRCRWIP